MYSTTTLDRIIRLSDEYVGIVSATEWSDDDRWRVIEIRRALEGLWPKRRMELVQTAHGRPRLISAPDPRSVRQVARSIAHGIAPLPQGGD